MRQHVDGDFPFANDFNAVARGALTGDCVLSGCSVTDGGTDDMNVDVASGTITYDGVATSISSTSKTLDAADGSNDRYDLLVAGDDGTVDVVTGTPSTEPAAPAIPDNHVLLAIVHVVAGTSGVTDGDINDARAVMSDISPDVLTGDAVPSGIITLWSGSIGSIPAGWVLCDGANGTPNLQDRFVVGAGSSFGVGATGGESTHTLTENELASHNHDITHGDSFSGTPSSLGQGQTNDGKFGSDSTGGDSAHENKPPYYALAYIMHT